MMHMVCESCNCPMTSGAGFGVATTFCKKWAMRLLEHYKACHPAALHGAPHSGRFPFGTAWTRRDRDAEVDEK
eukprot:symbB.v1.2.006029.t1/scaffold328.1/size228725/4